MRRRLVLLAGGWYLLVPPGNNIDEPQLHLWSQTAAFSTVEQCEREREKGRSEILAWGARSPKTETNRAIVEAIALKSRCIASDDPRLAPKR